MAAADIIEIDEARVEEFAGQVIADVAATFTTVASAIGHRLGLWRALAEGGPATSDELAARTGCVERYVREWCALAASAGYVTYDPADGRFTLPTEHALVLVHDTTVAYLGGAAQMARGMIEGADGVEAAFKSGGGVPVSEYGDNFWSGLEAVTGTAFDTGLVQEWIPSIDGLQEKLERGALVADVGCGSGRALIRLAEAFPRSVFHGYDASPEAVARAQAAVEAAGVADRVSIHLADGSVGIPGRYDLITTFDVIHDSADPRGLIASIRSSLKPDGAYMCLEIASSAHLEENVGPLAALKYGCSVFYCMTTSLASGGAGLGTCGVHGAHLRELCQEAGFADVEQIAEDLFAQVYRIRP